jgi:hypothetical protein
LRSSRSIAAILGVGGAAAIVLAAAGAYALMDPVAPDPASSSDEIIRTAPAELTDPAPAGGPIVVADAAVVAASPTDASALSAAVRGPTPPPLPPVQWADDGGAAAPNWAQPRMSDARSFVGRYQPRFDMALVRKGAGDEAQLQLALGGGDRPQAQAAQVTRLGFTAAPRALQQKGHWFLFAAGGGNAVGLNLLRDPSGEIRRAGWSAEHIAAVGSGQVGIGWRKGPVQASFGFVQRELSAYGTSVNERFVAFTISISPQGVSVGRSGRAWVERGGDYPSYRR